MAKPNRWVLLGSGGLAALVAVSACLMLLSTGPSYVHKQAEVLNTYDVAKPPPPPAMLQTPSVNAPAAEVAVADDVVPATAAIPITAPQVTYSYTLGYRLPASAIAGAQQAHLDLCNKLGPRCQLVAMQRASDDDGVSQASLKLRVASNLAQAVSADFTRLVGKAGGRAVDTQISAEDVSKDLVDTGARIHQREILVARLTEMLRGRAGKVGELVEAERSVAQAQEELDQAKGWMGELKGRVAYSDFTLGYTPVTAPVAAPSREGFFGQIGDAVVQSGAVIAGAARTLLLFAIFLIPWLGILGLLGWFARPALRKWRSAGLTPVNEDA
jgi:hypothetical protein